MKDLSIFIDESGDFGTLQSHSPYYILSMVFHDQRNSLAEPLSFLHSKLTDLDFETNHAIHTAPIIRRENVYRFRDVTVRKKLFNALADFLRCAPITVQGFVFDKRVHGSGDELEEAMSRELGEFVSRNFEYFDNWDRIIIYYDNGQSEVRRLVSRVVNDMVRAESRLISPSDYTLFQVADLTCTLVLIREKLNSPQGGLSQSESDFFRTPKVSASKNLKKHYFRTLEAKKFPDVWQ